MRRFRLQSVISFAAFILTNQNVFSRKAIMVFFKKKMAIGSSNWHTLKMKTLKAAKLKFMLRASQEGTDGIESQYLQTDPPYPVR